MLDGHLIWINNYPYEDTFIKFTVKNRNTCKTTYRLVKCDYPLTQQLAFVLGTPLCQPHFCHHIGAQGTHFVIHGLTCRKSKGCHHHHSSIHESVQPFVSQNSFTPGINTGNGKRSDGISLVSWKCGKLLFWDATCPGLLLSDQISC